MIFIKPPNMNDSFSSISIEGKSYFLRFTYNEKGDYWNFGLYDTNKEPIIAMTKIVKDFPILWFYSDEEIPCGEFACISATEEIGRNAFEDGSAEFMYIPYSEVNYG